MAVIVFTFMFIPDNKLSAFNEYEEVVAYDADVAVFAFPYSDAVIPDKFLHFNVV